MDIFPIEEIEVENAETIFLRTQIILVPNCSLWSNKEIDNHPLSFRSKITEL